jgi:hypothetical protein
MIAVVVRSRDSDTLVQDLCYGAYRRRSFACCSIGRIPQAGTTSSVGLLGGAEWLYNDGVARHYDEPLGPCDDAILHR